MAYRSQNVSSTTAAHPCSVAAPSGIQNGDILVLFVATDSFGPSTFTFPAGFTQVSGSPLYTESLDACEFAVAIKVASGESGAYSVSNSNTRAMVGGILCFSGRNASATPQAASANTTTTGAASPWNISATTVTPIAGCDLVFLGASDCSPGGDVAHAAPSTYTLVHDFNDVGAGIHFGSAYKENVSAGATGTVTGTGTLGGSTSDTLAFLISLQAAGGGAAAASTLMLMGMGT